MQLINSFSKILIFVLLSCSFLIVLRSNNFDITPPNFTNTEVSKIVESDDTIWNSISDKFKLDHKTNNAHVKAEIRELLSDQQKLQQIAIDVLQARTGVSRNTILRARRGQRVHTRSLRLLCEAIAVLSRTRQH